MKEWTVSDTANMKYVGCIEIETNILPDGEIDHEYFEIYETPEKLLFGTHCNCGFLESGYMIKDNDFSSDENLQELIQDLETYYRDGKNYCNRIICNERM